MDLLDEFNQEWNSKIDDKLFKDDKLFIDDKSYLNDLLLNKYKLINNKIK